MSYETTTLGAGLNNATEQGVGLAAAPASQPAPAAPASDTLEIAAQRKLDGDLQTWKVNKVACLLNLISRYNSQIASIHKEIESVSTQTYIPEECKQV